jgi:Sucrose hydrolase-like, C-terminal domain
VCPPLVDALFGLGMVLGRALVATAAALDVHNFADRPAKADLDLDADREAGVAELFADQRYPRPDVAAGSVPVDGYGYRWFRFRG